MGVTWDRSGPGTSAPRLAGRLDALLPGMQMPDEYPEPRHAAGDVQAGLFTREDA
jgi:hypothetical protein